MRLSTLDVEACMGPDGFYFELLSSCRVVAYPTYLIFEKSLQYGQLPTRWKESLVTPLFIATVISIATSK